MMPEDTDAVAKADAASEVETPLADDGRALDAEVEAPAPPPTRPMTRCATSCRPISMSVGSSGPTASPTTAADASRA